MAKFYYNEQEIGEKFAVSEKTTFPTFQKHFPEAIQTICTLKKGLGFLDAKKLADSLTNMTFGEGKSTLLFFTIAGKKLRVVSVRKGGQES